MSKKKQKIIKGQKKQKRNSNNFYDNSYGNKNSRRQPYFVEEDAVYFEDGKPVFEEDYIEEYDYPTRHKNRPDNYSNEQNNRGHGRNDKGSKDKRKSVSHTKMSKKAQRKEDFERQVMRDYESALTSRERRPFSLKYFGKNYSERDLAEYQYEIDKLNWLIDPHNRPKLIDKAEEILRRTFGPDADTRYGISNKYRLADVPQDEPSRNAERHVFPYSDDYLVGLRKSPKIPIGPWEIRHSDRMNTIQTRKYLCMVNGEVLLGEMTVDTCHMYDSIVKDGKSGIKFCIYYRGLEEGKFIVERWDYEPLSQHPNKFDAQNQFCINGVLCDKTKYSHRHIYNRFNRLVLTQNQSPDIKPTPINYKSKEYTTEEARYASFADMIVDFEKEFHVESTQVPVHEVQSHRLKDLGKDYCVNYDTYSKVTMPGPKYAELKARGKMADTEEISEVYEEITPNKVKDFSVTVPDVTNTNSNYTGTQLTLEDIYGKMQDISEFVGEVQIDNVDGLDQVKIAFPVKPKKEEDKTPVEVAEEKRKTDPEQGGGQELW